MANFEQINFKNGEAPYLSKQELNKLQTRINQAITDTKTEIETEQTQKSTLKDITNQCTFVNCTFDGGKALLDEEKRMVYLSFAVTPTITSSWKEIVELPLTLESIDLIGPEMGMPIIGGNIWINKVQNKILVRGELKANQQIGVYGFYFLKEGVNND